MNERQSPPINAAFWPSTGEWKVLVSPPTLHAPHGCSFEVALYLMREENIRIGRRELRRCLRLPEIKLAIAVGIMGLDEARNLVWKFGAETQ